jgi:phosphoribosylglycinamide formyltransferase-1
MKNFAVFISGYGRGAIEIIKDFKNELIKPYLSLILSNNEHSYALKVAKENNINTVIIKKNHNQSNDDFENEILKELYKHKIDYIFLAGWMYIIREKLLTAYPKRIVNIHPSLLPSFKGANAIEQALKYKVKITGITTHFVDNTIDGGEIIDQKCVRVNEDDNFKTLDNKIFKAGTILTVETINKIFI